MRWWDIEAVMVLERELFGETAWSPAQFWGELAQPNRTYVVDEDEGGLTGYAGLMAVPPTADIQTVAVAPRAQRRGIASELLRHLLSVADERCTQTFLEVAADNPGAVAVYERAGFTVIARRASYYGPGRDALIMRRDRARGGA